MHSIMKKFFYLLCALPMLLLAPCSDIDKVREFVVEVTFVPDVIIVDNVITEPQEKS